MQPVLAMIPRLSVRLLGPLEVRLHGQLVGGFDYNKVRALLAYLAHEAHQPQPRQYLCALLWPDAAERAARQNLSQALTRLRRALQDNDDNAPLILATTETIQLNPAAGLEVDTAQVSALLAAAETHAAVHGGWKLCTPCNRRLAQAAALYRGDFLQQFFLADSAPFEEWALLLRERWRQVMLSVFERLAQHAEWRGNDALAADYTRHLVTLEPWLEGNQRALMRRLAQAGQAAAALAQYEQLRRLLAESLGIEPDAETNTLAGQIRAGVLDRPAGARPATCLPQAPTPFIGRQDDLQAVTERLHAAEVRALTLTGTPGIGKTRLALEAAQQLCYDFEHGVCLVELAPLAEPALLPSAVAQALDVKAPAGKPLAAAVSAHLRDKHLLLVLDNFEHLLDGAAWVAQLLLECPGLKVLVTSRAPLRIRAEQQYALSPLSVPEAVELFVARARAARTGLDLDTPAGAASAGPIAEICARLDGLPLAIELIAVRAQTLSPQELLQQLDQRLSALTWGARDAPERHRTLRSAIAWSYDRLLPEEQRLFAHLGVFAGGCTAQAAQAVAGVPYSVLPMLESLHESSLLQAQDAGGETRFSLLETLGEFALEALAASGEAPAARQRHAAWVEQLAEDAYQQLLGPDQVAWSARVAAELDNVRAALRWAEGHGQVETSLRIATGMFRFWWQRGMLREGLNWFEPALAQREGAPLAVQSRALRAAGVLALGLRDFTRARQWMEDAIQAGRQAGDAYAVAAATTNLGLVLQEQGEWQGAGESLAEALALNRALPGQPHAIKFPLLVLAGLLLRMGQPREAARLYAEGLSHNRELGDVEGTGNALYGLSAAARAQGDYAAARQLAEESLSLYRSLEHQNGQALAHYHLGNSLRDAQQPAEARAHYQHSLRIWLRREDAVGAAPVLEDVARLLSQQGQWPRAARLMAAADSLRREAQALLTPHEEGRRDDWLAACRAALGDQAFEQAWDAGQMLRLEEAVSLALQEE